MSFCSAPDPTRVQREARLAALEEAYYSGVTRASFEGRSIEYRTMADMRRAIDELRTLLSGRRVRQLHVRTRGDKGL